MIYIDTKYGTIHILVLKPKRRKKNIQKNIHQEKEMQKCKRRKRKLRNAADC